MPNKKCKIMIFTIISYIASALYSLTTTNCFLSNEIVLFLERMTTAKLKMISLHIIVHVIQH